MKGVNINSGLAAMGRETHAVYSPGYAESSKSLVLTRKLGKKR
jgi:hypothetical protein